LFMCFCCQDRHQTKAQQDVGVDSHNTAMLLVTFWHILCCC
jgi:hypothetical protein